MRKYAFHLAPDGKLLDQLSIDRAGTYLTRPDLEEKIVEGDRLLVYANRKSTKQILD
jgi:uncharacterized protein with PhoU and TrkA domain